MTHVRFAGSQGLVSLFGLFERSDSPGTEAPRCPCMRACMPCVAQNTRLCGKTSATCHLIILISFLTECCAMRHVRFVGVSIPFNTIPPLVVVPIISDIAATNWNCLATITTTIHPPITASATAVTTSASSCRSTWRREYCPTTPSRWVPRHKKRHRDYVCGVARRSRHSLSAHCDLQQ